MKRKVIALLCTMALTVSVLAGCGKEPAGGQADEKPSESKTEESAASSPEAEEESSGAEGEAAGNGELEYVELDWYFCINGAGTDADLIQQALDAYFKEKLNCKVNLHVLGSDYKDVVSNMLLSGEEVDLVMLDGGRGVSYLTYAGQDAFYPLEELWEYGPNVKALFKDEVWNAVKVNDHIYCVPTLKDNAYIMGFVYNDTMAADLGLDVEGQQWNNMMDIEEFAMEAVKLRDEKFPEYAGMPLVAQAPIPVPYFYALEQMVSSFAVCNVPGLEADSAYDTDTVFNFYESDAYREYALLNQRFVEAGVFAYDYNSLNGPAIYMSSTLLCPAWGYTWISEDLHGDVYKTKLKVFDKVWTDTSNYTGVGNAIGANCKNPERAMMVLDLLNSDPYVATMLRFGVEGEHWEYDGDGKIQLCNRNADVSNAGWLEWYGVYAGNLTIVDGPESYVGPDRAVLENIKKYNDEALVAAHMGFVVDTTPIANEIAACSSVEAEYTSRLNTGQLASQEDVNKTLDEFIEKLKANGSEKIVTEVQRQLDEWKAGQ